MMGDWIPYLIDRAGIAGVALLMFLETVFPPIPSEVIMPLAGMRVSQGSMALVPLIAAGSLGAMIGNVAWFAVARTLGIERFRRLIERHGRWLTMAWSDIERAQRAFERHGSVMVFVGRLIPTIRSVISIPAGLLGMSWPRFLIWSSFGTATWTAILAVGGLYLRERYASIETYVGPVSTSILVTLVGIYIIRVVRWRPHA